MEAEENNTITVENKIHGGDKSSGAGTYVCDFSSPIVAGDISTMQNLAGRSYYDGKDSFYEKLNKSSGLSLVFNLRHTNLDLLLFYEEVIKSGGFNQYRYFLLNEKREKVEQELGVLRTNCIGCLDCTNVTQSMVGRKMLKFQLRRLGAFDDVETISAHPNLDQSFKLLWAIHGDDISIQYSGTPALKGNFVRCGHRTAQGVLADRCNALTRYYLNNFVDGTKQVEILIIMSTDVHSNGNAHSQNAPFKIFIGCDPREDVAYEVPCCLRITIWWRNLPTLTGNVSRNVLFMPEVLVPKGFLKLLMTLLTLPVLISFELPVSRLHSL